MIPDPDAASKQEEEFVEPAEISEALTYQEKDMPTEELLEDITAAQEHTALKERIRLLEEEVKSSKEGISEEVSKRRQERRKRKKEKKAESLKKYPTLGEIIYYRENGQEDWIKAKVFRVFKKTSIHKHVKQLLLDDGSQVERNFEEEVAEWKPVVKRMNCHLIWSQVKRMENYSWWRPSLLKS